MSAILLIVLDDLFSLAVVGSQRYRWFNTTEYVSFNLYL